MVLPVRRRTHCGMGRFCFCFLASVRLVRKDLKDGWGGRCGGRVVSVRAWISTVMCRRVVCVHTSAVWRHPNGRRARRRRRGLGGGFAGAPRPAPTRRGHPATRIRRGGTQAARDVDSPAAASTRPPAETPPSPRRQQGGLLVSFAPSIRKAARTLRQRLAGEQSATAGDAQHRAGWDAVAGGPRRCGRGPPPPASSGER